MKKILALALCLVMVLALAACGGTEAPETTPSTTAPKDTTPATTQPAELNTDWIWEDKTMSGEVTFAIPFKGSQGMDAMIAAFNEIYPNVEIKLNTYSNNSDGNASVNTAILAGDVGEFPHIADADGAAGAEQNETKTASQSFTLHKTSSFQNHPIIVRMVMKSQP
mgnify:CR=1 FL=1